MGQCVAPWRCSVNTIIYVNQVPPFSFPSHWVPLTFKGPNEMSASPISLNFIAADVHLFLITLIVPIFGGAGVFFPAPGRIPCQAPLPSLGLHRLRCALYSGMVRDDPSWPGMQLVCFIIGCAAETLRSKGSRTLPHAGRVCMTMMGVQRKSLSNTKKFPTLS